MKKEQILQVIESEVEQMQIIYYDMVENLGSQHEVTKRQEIRLSTLLLLSQKLGL
jgi:helix-turn-helix protein